MTLLVFLALAAYALGVVTIVHFAAKIARPSIDRENRQEKKKQEHVTLFWMNK